ncbi:MAG: hypothetical protein PHT15_02245 [Gallionellaceae bacterium]|nr:hypothetical protein [Gallionellaceae bacterium]
MNKALLGMAKRQSVKREVQPCRGGKSDSGQEKHAWNMPGIAGRMVLSAQARPWLLKAAFSL